MNIMELEGYKAKIEYDPELDPRRDSSMVVRTSMARVRPVFVESSRILSRCFLKCVKRKVLSRPRNTQEGSTLESRADCTKRSQHEPRRKIKASISGSPRFSNGR